jgi:hypothetical protein
MISRIRVKCKVRKDSVGSAYSEWRDADVLSYYSEDGDHHIKEHFAVIKWCDNGKREVIRIHHADSCFDVDTIEVKEHMYNVTVTKSSNGILFSSAIDAEAFRDHLNQTIHNALHVAGDPEKGYGMWNLGDASAWAGCELNFEIHEEWV